MWLVRQRHGQETTGRLRYDLALLELQWVAPRYQAARQMIPETLEAKETQYMSYWKNVSPNVALRVRSAPDDLLKWSHAARGSLVLKTLRFLFLTGLFLFITLTVLSMVLESTGISRAASTPRNMEFEPTANQKVYKFTDVHGVDEAKEVCPSFCFIAILSRYIVLVGPHGNSAILERSRKLLYTWWEVTERRPSDGTTWHG